MAYQFRLLGARVWHSWQKECRVADAKLHATLVAREYANDDLYRGTSISVTDEDGSEIAVVPVAPRR